MEVLSPVGRFRALGLLLTGEVADAGTGSENPMVWGRKL